MTQLYYRTLSHVWTARVNHYAHFILQLAWRQL